jgi:hypothetical protein
MRTTILFGAQGAGKSSAGRAIAARLGCSAVVNDWNGRSPLPKGVLVLTNLAPGQCRLPPKVSTLDFHQALRLL